MDPRRKFLALSFASIASLRTLKAQSRGEESSEQSSEKRIQFLCPMDADVRQFQPGTCPRCGMKLVAGLPDPVEYPVRLTMTPAAPVPGQKVRLRFTILHPKTGLPFPDLELVHERIFHLFLISEDLQHFAHEHPRLTSPGHLELDWVFPVGGMWRLLTDFYPAHATPQLVPKTVLLPGALLPAPTLHPDTKEMKSGANLKVSLRLGPEQPVAGEKTLLYYRIEPRESFEPFLGAMGHMLVASADLIDLLHTHPFLVDGGLAAPPRDAKLVQFNVIFPRPGLYRVWTQFQRAGIVNTIPFTVAVRDL